MQYSFVRPTQWDPEEEEGYKWPKLRHIEPDEKRTPPAQRPAWADAKLNPRSADVLCASCLFSPPPPPTP